MSKGPLETIEKMLGQIVDERNKGPKRKLAEKVLGEVEDLVELVQESSSDDEIEGLRGEVEDLREKLTESQDQLNWYKVKAGRARDMTAPST